MSSSGFRGLQAKKSIRELEGRLENQQSATLPSMVRQLQGKTTHLSAFQHWGWLLHQSTKAPKRITKKSNFGRYVTCSSWKNLQLSWLELKSLTTLPPSTQYGISQDSLFFFFAYIIIKALVWQPFIKTSLKQFLRNHDNQLPLVENS